MSTSIAFIGAGIATSYTLIPFLEKLAGKNTANVELVIIDKSNDLFKGMPYGGRSGKSVLLIQDLKNFITEPHRSHFKNWLNENLETLVSEFVSSGGAFAKKWVEKNHNSYSQGEWNNLYVPRFFFGNYIAQEVLGRIDKLVAENKLAVNYLVKETISIEKKTPGFKIHFRDQTNIDVDKIVLSIGSLPYKQLYKKEIEHTKNALFIKEPYGLGMENNMAQIAKFIQVRNKNKLNTKIAVLGANASGLEMIYKICDKLPILDYNTSFTTLSSHGVMPDGTFDEKKAKQFRAKNLQSLNTAENLSANEIAEAAHKDIDEAENLGIGAATTVGIISNGFGSLLPKLSKEELLNFACFHGNQIGRRQRCAGNHYLSVVEELSTRKRFKHIKGRFLELEEKPDGLRLFYSATDNTESKTGAETFNIVINCLGSVDLTSNDLSPFFKNLIDNGLTTPNPSKIGFTVDENLEASENLFVAGPLLAGNQIEEKVFWHLEHCARIIWSSEVLSKKLIASLN